MSKLRRTANVRVAHTYLNVLADLTDSLTHIQASGS